MCKIDILISVWFWFSFKKTQIQFGMSLVRFGLKKYGSVRILQLLTTYIIVE